MTADVLDLAEIAAPDFASEERQPVSRWVGEGCGAVLWLEPRSDGGWEQFIEAVRGTPGCWGELLFSCSSDWSYSEDLYANDLFVSGFVVSAVVREKVISFVSGVAPSETGRLLSSENDETIHVLSPTSNPGGHFIAAVAGSARPAVSWQAEPGRRLETDISSRRPRSEG